MASEKLRVVWGRNDNIERDEHILGIDSVKLTDRLKIR